MSETNLRSNIEPQIQLTQDPVCSHEITKASKGMPQLEECKQCKTAFFKVN